MNYRHRYHAGNPADVMKHALLCALIDHLQRKPKPMTIFDTHAGAGIYDLDGCEARRTGEWRAGIGRFSGDGWASPALGRYLGAVAAVQAEAGSRSGRLYPGSAALIQRLMGDDDRLIAIERHPEEFQALKRAMGGDRRVACHFRDAYEGLPALIPPVPKRGFALIDPPFERTDEFAAILNGLKAVERRWPVGVVAVWYPIKSRHTVDAFLGDLVLSGRTGILMAELLWAAPVDPVRLNGSGVVVINAPYRLDTAFEPVLDEVAEQLGAKPGALIRWLVERA